MAKPRKATKSGPSTPHYARSGVKLEVVMGVELARRLAEYAAEKSLTKSEVVRRAIEMLLTEEQ